MKLETLVIKDVWKGRKIDRPVNHDLAKYSAPVMGDPMSLVESIEHLPAMGEDYELPLWFKVRSLIPFNYAGELYYEYFAHVRDYKIVEVRETGVLLEFVAMAACNIVEGKSSPVDVLPEYCGVAQQYLRENPTLLEPDELDEEEEIELEGELSDNHACGIINDALIVLHDMKGTKLTVDYDQANVVEDYLYGSGKDNFSQFSDEELDAFNRKSYGFIDFVETVTAPAGDEYRLIIMPHED